MTNNKITMLKQIMLDFDNAKDDAAFEANHPIFLMAEHIDSLTNQPLLRDRLPTVEDQFFAG